MTVNDLLDHFQVKNDLQLSIKLDLGRSTISGWRNQGIPYLRQRDFQLQTKGKLKAEKDHQLAV